MWFCPQAAAITQLEAVVSEKAAAVSQLQAKVSERDATMTSKVSKGLGLAGCKACAHLGGV